MNNPDPRIQIIKKHQHSSPVNVIPIAEDLGINVFLADTDDSISGKICKDKELGGESGYAIFVNKNHSKQRQRFTIAHEIAHYLIHKDLIGDGLIEDALYRSGLSNKIETEANKLAATILMPWHLIAEALKKFTTVSDMAKEFNVSVSAMSIRLGVPE